MARPGDLTVAVLVIFAFVTPPLARAVEFPALRNLRVPVLLEGKRIGIVEPEPLLRYAPPGFRAMDISTSRELFEASESGQRAFVPMQHAAMVQEITALALGHAGPSVDRFPSFQAARHRVDIIILPRILRYQVTFGAASTRALRADAALRFTVFDGAGERVLWDGEAAADVSWEASDGPLRSAAEAELLKEGVDVLLIGEDTGLRPLRVLLAIATYNAVVEMAAKLEPSRPAKP